MRANAAITSFHETMLLPEMMKTVSRVDTDEHRPTRTYTDVYDYDHEREVEG